MKLLLLILIVYCLKLSLAAFTICRNTECKEIHLCNVPNVLNLPICGFNRNTPLVCCPIRAPSVESNTSPPIQTNNPVVNLNTGSRISVRKCEEYSKPVTNSVEALLLLPDATTITKVVPKCDYRNVPLIVGGEEVTIGEFPHMVALGYGSSPNYEFTCGGSLISENFVLTAAHCTKTSQYGDPVVARLGEHNLASDDDGAKPINIEISQVIIHPEYRPPRKYNDIALLRLKTFVTFSKFIRPACIPETSPPSNSKVVATGWGRIAYYFTNAEEASPKLLKVVLPLVNENRCSQLWSGPVQTSTTLPRGIDHETMLCAGAEGGKDTCLGDSGGPLSVTNTKNDCVHYIIGVTSFGKFCGFRDSPGIYTKVSHYVNWIEKTVWPNQ